MRWWSFDGDPEVLLSKPDPSYPQSQIVFFKPDKGTIMDQVEITKPTLVNIRDYHDIKNGPRIRRMLSFRFDPEPYHLIQDDQQG